MSKLTATDALSLSVLERIQLVEDIWDTITLEADAVALTEDEKKIIDERLISYHRDPSSGSPWEDVLRRLTEKT